MSKEFQMQTIQDRPMKMSTKTRGWRRGRVREAEIILESLGWCVADVRSVTDGGGALWAVVTRDDRFTARPAERFFSRGDAIMDFVAHLDPVRHTEDEEPWQRLAEAGWGWAEDVAVCRYCHQVEVLQLCMEYVEVA